MSVLLLGCATAGTSVATPAAAPARTETFTTEMYLGLMQVSEARISPDGAQVAYVLSVPRAEGDGPGAPWRQIWLIDSAGGRARRLTAPYADAWSPRWAPDGRTLAFLSQRKSYHGKPQVFAIPVGGGEATPLTKHETGVGGFAYAPDGARLVYWATAPDSPERKAALKGKQDWKVEGQYRGHRRLWLVELAGARVAATQVTSELHVLNASWSPRGDALLVHATQNPDADEELIHSQLYRLDLRGSAPAAMTQLTQREGKLGPGAWSPSGARIAFTAGVDLNDPTAGSLFVMNADGSAARSLSEGFLGTLRWADWLDDDTVVFAAIEGPGTSLYRLPLGRGRRARLETGAALCYQPHLAADRRRYACAADTAQHPAEVHVGQIPGAPLRRLTVTNPGLERVRFATQEVVTWRAADGWEIQGVYIAPRAGSGPAPLVVLPHGGPEGSDENGWKGYPGQILAARGYAVLYPNYRGSAGRGVAFSKGDHEDLGGKEFDDILAGVDSLAARGAIDPGRVGIGGWSYGGYLSAWAGTRHSERFRAAVMGAGISNWMSFTGTTDIPAEMSLVHWALWPFEHPELAWERSPMAYLSKAKTPMLILHGAADARVPPSQGLEMYRGLRHAGVEVELVTYPRAGHGVREQAHRADVVERFVGWFERHLGAPSP
ncbi:S9 family peptidase [Haliangium sp.]|uniref:S9 family peptidase n=1 Tax=Haliangium sp. TaxID=2663208 RepID=UPI003D0E9E99